MLSEDIEDVKMTEFKCLRDVCDEKHIDGNNISLDMVGHKSVNLKTKQYNLSKMKYQKKKVWEKSEWSIHEPWEHCKEVKNMDSVLKEQKSKIF